jgi:hypothetical protein
MQPADVTFKILTENTADFLSLMRGERDAGRVLGFLRFLQVLKNPDGTR